MLTSLPFCQSPVISTYVEGLPLGRLPTAHLLVVGPRVHSVMESKVEDGGQPGPWLRPYPSNSGSRKNTLLFISTGALPYRVLRSLYCRTASLVTFYFLQSLTRLRLSAVPRLQRPLAKGPFTWKEYHDRLHHNCRLWRIHSSDRILVRDGCASFQAAEISRPVVALTQLLGHHCRSQPLPLRATSCL